MILQRLSICIIVLILSAGLTITAAVGASEENQPSIDFWDLLALFMIPESATVLDWGTGNQEDSPILWKTPGVQWDKRHRSYARSGQVIVTFNGHPSYHLERYVTPSAWTIHLYGSRTGVMEVVLDTTYPGGPDLENAANRGVQLDLLKCDPNLMVSSGVRLYRMKAPGKRQAYLLHGWSCGSGGCSSNLNLFLSREAADLAPNLVTNCDPDGWLDYESKQFSLGGEIVQQNSSGERRDDDSREPKRDWILKTRRSICIENSRCGDRFELVLTNDQAAQCENLSHQEAIVIGRLVPPDSDRRPYEKIQVYEIRPISYEDWKRNYGLGEGRIEAKP